MIWMILGCLALPAILFFASGKLSSGDFIWKILIGVFIAGHFWMMFRGHGLHGSNRPNCEPVQKVESPIDKENRL